MMTKPYTSAIFTALMLWHAMSMVAKADDISISKGIATSSMGFHQADILTSQPENADDVALPTQALVPEVIYLDELTKFDEYAIAMLSLPDGGRLSHCRSSNTTYMFLPGSVDRMNIVAKSPPYDIEGAEDIAIRYAKHETLENVFPTVAVLFANESSNANVNDTKFRLYTLTMLDLVSQPEDSDLMYRVEITNVTETFGTRPNGTSLTASVPATDYFSVDGRSREFPAGTLMMDLIDVNDASIDETRKMYTLAHMAKTGELAYHADKLASGDAQVRAQGVLTLWMLGPFSIPLYPAFIACCSASLFIWYLIQPFFFCCII